MMGQGTLRLWLQCVRSSGFEDPLFVKGLKGLEDGKSHWGFYLAQTGVIA